VLIDVIGKIRLCGKTDGRVVVKEDSENSALSLCRRLSRVAMIPDQDFAAGGSKDPPEVLKGRRLPIQ
jgi:hypothetical protein